MKNAFAPRARAALARRSDRFSKFRNRRPRRHDAFPVTRDSCMRATFWRARGLAPDKSDTNQTRGDGGVDGFGAVGSPNDKRPFNRRPSRPRCRRPRAAARRQWPEGRRADRARRPVNHPRRRLNQRARVSPDPPLFG